MRHFAGLLVGVLRYLKCKGPVQQLGEGGLNKGPHYRVAFSKSSQAVTSGNAQIWSKQVTNILLLIFLITANVIFLENSLSALL